MNWPFQIQPRSQKERRQFVLFSPFSKAFSFSIVRNKSVCSFVSLVLFMCHPSTIDWLVVSVVINPVQCASSRDIAHVGVKAIKLSPSLANRNASPAIISIVSAPIVCASVNHCFPSLIRRTSRFSVCCKAVRCADDSPATATVANAFPQLSTLNSPNSPAATLNDPLAVTTFRVTGALNDGPVSKHLAS